MIGVVREGVAVPRLLMATARSIFVGELFMMFVAEKSDPMTFPLLRSFLRSERPCVYVGDDVVAGYPGQDKRLLKDEAYRVSS